MKEVTQVSALLVLLCMAYVKHMTPKASLEIPSTPVRVELQIHTMFAPPGAYNMFINFLSVTTLMSFLAVLSSHESFLPVC